MNITVKSSDNSKIAKNTLMLYFRMAIIMLVTLYTSKIILNALGVVDFGIYNIVAGVVVMFTFLNSALMNASQRYLSISVGFGKQEQLQKVFSTSLRLHSLLAVIIIIIAETVGLWFLNERLNIPDDRLVAANWVYHISILSTCINVLRVPYNALIIAKEDMSFFAYLSVLETILRLSIAWLIMYFTFDRLMSYSILLLISTILVSIIYMIKCHKSYNVTLSLKADKSLIRELSSFAGWNVFGAVADVGYKQGTNIILNKFCGVTLNAAMGIAVQVRTAIYSFVSNLQTAANPQIMKLYSSKEYDKYSNLVYKISKYSFFLIYILAFPVIINIHTLLDFWLINPPEYAYSYCSLTLIFCLVDSLSGPLWVSMQAMGKIRNYQVIISILLLLNLPLTYIALDCEMSPDTLLYIQIMICIITLFVRILFSQKYAYLSLFMYFKEVLLPILMVVILSLPIPLVSSLYFTGVARLIITIVTCLSMSLISIWTCGLKCSERQIVIEYVKSKICKK